MLPHILLNGFMILLPFYGSLNPFVFVLISKKTSFENFQSISRCDIKISTFPETRYLNKLCNTFISPPLNFKRKFSEILIRFLLNNWLKYVKLYYIFPNSKKSKSLELITTYFVFIPFTKDYFTMTILVKLLFALNLLFF